MLETAALQGRHFVAEVDRNQIGTALASSLELDEILNKTLALLMAHFQVEAGEIFLKEEDNETLRLVLHRGEAAEARLEFVRPEDHLGGQSDPEEEGNRDKSASTRDRIDPPRGDTSREEHRVEPGGERHPFRSRTRPSITITYSPFISLEEHVA